MANLIEMVEDQEKLQEIAEMQKAQLEEQASIDEQVAALKKQVAERADWRKKNFERTGQRGDTNSFLVLVMYNNDETHWEIFPSRQETYDFIKDSREDIDWVETKVISETLSFIDGISAAAFMAHVIETGKIEDPGFDPFEYIPGDYDVINDGYKEEEGDEYDG